MPVRIDGEDQRLDHVVEQMREADCTQHGVHRALGFARGGGRCGRGAGCASGGDGAFVEARFHKVEKGWEKSSSGPAGMGCNTGCDTGTQPLHFIRRGLFVSSGSLVWLGVIVPPSFVANRTSRHAIFASFRCIGIVPDTGFGWSEMLLNGFLDVYKPTRRRVAHEAARHGARDCAARVRLKIYSVVPLTGKDRR